MKLPLTNSASRLIVAADFKGTLDEVREKVLELGRKLQGTGVIIKLNSALRLCGYGIILELQALGLQVFADLKLNDIPETLGTDGALLAQYKPALVTVMASSGHKAINALVTAMPKTEVLAVTVLTSMDGSDALSIYGKQTVVAAANSLAFVAETGKADGLILSPQELGPLRLTYRDDFTYNTPGIRPKWVDVKGDDQKRIMTPSEAIQAGADRIVVGRPITQSDDPLEAIKRTILEIEAGLAMRYKL